MQYLGNFAEDATVYIPFNTFSSNDPQASVTITNLAAADIKVHKDGGLTQIATDGATIAIDFDSITGNHLITIDTSVHADYSIGSDYIVRIEGTTVDAGTINAFIGSFSIENRFDQQTGDSFARIGAAGASLTNIGTIATVTTLTNKTGFSLASTGLDAISQAATGMIEIAKAVWDRVLSGATHNINTSAGKRLRQVDALFIIDSGTAQAGTATTITLAATASATDNIYKGDRATIVAGTGISEHELIIAYNGTTKVATVSGTWTITPDNTSEYELTPATVDIETWQHVVVTNSATSNKPEVDVFSISDDSTAANNAELDYDGTGYDKANSTIGTTTANTDMRGTDSAATAANLATVGANVDAIKVPTDKMVFTKANELDTNTQSINGATVVGDGNATPWDGA